MPKEWRRALSFLGTMVPARVSLSALSLVSRWSSSSWGCLGVFRNPQSFTPLTESEGLGFSCAFSFEVAGPATE